MEHREIIRQADAAGVQLVSFLYCDNGGVIRGKATHTAGLAARLHSGIGLTTAMQAMTDMDQLLPVPGMGPVGEVRLIPDCDTFTILPYAPRRRALMLADLVTTAQQPWDACPRDFLKRMLARAGELGIGDIQAAMEPEWYLARREGDRYIPADESLDNHSVGMTFAQDVVDDIVDALQTQGLQVEQYYPELGNGQQELSIRHASALRAADNHLIYRETVRNVAYRHGWLASFAPKPFPQQAGSGCHIHFSAWDAAGNTAGDAAGASNLFYDAADPHGISALAWHFIGGIMAHLPGLVALTCPSVNSYRRLSPGSWSTAFTCYGPDNREAALRIPSRFWGSEMASTNLEFRPADSSSNPYIALGGIIAAGLNGVARRLMPDADQMVDVDPARLPESERERRGIRRLPASLPEAIAALESDDTLMNALGPALANSYLAIRRADQELFSQQDVDFEIRHHFYKY